PRHLRSPLFPYTTLFRSMPYLVDQGYSLGALGFALSGVSIAYGLSKFLMGSVSDRSNARFFLPLGLVMSAAVSLTLGLTRWATSDRKSTRLNSSHRTISY